MAQRSDVATLIEFGQSPWYDNLTRALARGDLRQLVEHDGIRGVTSNPTIFEKAMGAGTDYDEQLRELGDIASDDAYWSLVVDDVRDACELLDGVHRETNGADGFVSVEVSPDLARDTHATITQAKELWGRIERPNLMIKIPATEPGIPAVTAVLAAGINVNITLIFSLDRYAQVMEAHTAGLEQLAANGGDPSKVHSVASFFVSRVDTETDKRLPEGHALRGKAAVANAKLAYQAFVDHLATPRWQALAAKGASVQRPLWASTSTKNPDYSPTLYVDELIGRDTVNTLAQASIDALQQHPGMRADTVRDDVDGARKVIADLAGAGVDFDDVTATLEREGVASFAKSYKDAVATLHSKRASL
ncbi:MAG TPA: transaldolase [Acidimicrobiia bacterium]|jgi:transaldolase